MKPVIRNTVSVIICVVLINGYAHGKQSPDSSSKISSVIKRARSEIQNKRYASAYKLLYEYDASHDNPDILALKIDLALKYSVKNIMNKSFAFVDLKPDQDLEEYSICPYCFKNVLVYDLRIEEILHNKLKKEPGNGHYNRLLGDYYFFVYIHTRESRKPSEDELLEEIDSLYTLAEEKGSATSASCDNHGIILMVQKNYTKAIAVLQMGLALDGSYCNSLYNIAYAYFMTGNNQLALKKAQESYVCFDEAANRADAAILAAQIYELQGMDEESYIYYTRAWLHGRNDYICAKKMLLLSMKLDRHEDPVKNAARLLMLDIYNLEYFNEILDLFILYKRTGELEEFLARLEKAFKDDPRVMGNIYAGKASISLRVYNDAAKKKYYLKKARARYREFYPEGHEVLQKIDRELK